MHNGILFLHFAYLDRTRDGVNAAQERSVPRGSRHLWRNPKSRIQNPQSGMHFCIRITPEMV